ncbi:MAG: hypothetical protein M3R06_00500 [Chloroflexota bacterium]|nr:hypothetical protein [Chloroflexota bacterium]
MAAKRDAADEFPRSRQEVETPERSEPGLSPAKPGRAARPVDEGPGAEGGSGLESDDEAASEGVGGGD